jgi:cytoskeletal protein CcmA (bactofilin family)
MNRFKQGRFWLTVVLGVVLSVTVTQTARAAVIAGTDVYRLPAGEVITDDLYIAASEIYIDGTVEGDLIAGGNTIVVNGTVTGDALLVGASIQLNGRVDGDMRAAGAEIAVAGSIGEDLIAGGGGGTRFPISAATQTLDPGIRLADSARVGGDALLGAGSGSVDGTIVGDLWLGMGATTLAARVGGDAEIASETISVADTATISGALRYTSAVPNPALEAIATTAQYTPPTPEQRPDPLAVVLGWVLRTALVLAGFALLAWLTLRLAPRLLTSPASALAAQPGRAGLYGLLAALLFIFLPLASALLVFVMVLFWGWFPGVVLGLALFGVLALLWFLSPLITGLWLGRRLALAFGREANDLAALLGGVLLLALLGRIPYVGWLVSLGSFVLALGALIVVRRAGNAGKPVGQALGQPVLAPTP